MKQENQVGSFNSCINEVQQQAYAQGLELQDARNGYLQSRREQARPQEEIQFSVKEKIARDAQIRSFARNGRNEERSRTTS